MTPEIEEALDSPDCSTEERDADAVFEWMLGKCGPELTEGEAVRDEELDAIRFVIASVTGLLPDAKERVLDYVTRRFCVPPRGEYRFEESC